MCVYIYICTKRMILLKYLKILIGKYRSENDYYQFIKYLLNIYIAIV